MTKKEWYRKIPPMDGILQSIFMQTLCTAYGRKNVMETVNSYLEEIREQIPFLEREEMLEELLCDLERVTQERLETSGQAHYRRVINGTGVILHTNLGRAPLPEKAVDAAAALMKGYGNLEYDLKEGKRGERTAHFEELICKATGAEAAMAVNNNAAAVLLMLSALARGKEVIVSRGEQVEIGGKFRIPDIIDQSGARRVEVGTTNKTRISDYEEAITENTAVLLKVHTSNFRMLGFTESVSREELAALGRKYRIPVIEDLGSGVLMDLSEFGLKKEPTVTDSLAAGAELVSFSGDKLLGGPQAGILAGKKTWIDQCKKHPLARAVRIDKFTAALLEGIFRLYQNPQEARKQIPVLSMLTETREVMERKAQKLLTLLGSLPENCTVQRITCQAPAGGGSLPGELLEDIGIAVCTEKNLNHLERQLRNEAVPLIARISEDRLILDMRTIREDEVEETASILKKVLCG